MTVDMNARLKGKYRTDRPVMGHAAHPRTNNTFHPVRDKVPSLVPCNRAPAGAKVFVPDVQPALPGRRVMQVDGLTGRKLMVWE